MNPATYRTLAEAMGLATTTVADDLDVAERTVRRWASMRAGEIVPDFAAAYVLEQWRDFHHEIMLDVADAKAQLSDSDETWTIRRSRSTSRDRAYVAALAVTFAQEGIPFEIVWDKTTRAND